MNCTSFCVRTVVLACLAGLPVTTMAGWMCTNAAGKTSFQDKPCEGKAPSTKWLPVKANELTLAASKETLSRFDAAVNERDMLAAGRLLSKNFKSVVVTPRSRSELNGADYMDLLTRTVQASKSYRSDRRCGEGEPEPLRQTLKLECRNTERVEQGRRARAAETHELIRLTLESGEIRISEISGIPASGAAASAPQRN